MESRVVVTPSGETCPYLSFSGFVLVAASDIRLHGIPQAPRLIALWRGYIHQSVQRPSEVPDGFQTVHARVVLHRLDDFCKGAKRSNVVCSRHAVERRNDRGSVSQPKPFKTPA